MDLQKENLNNYEEAYNPDAKYSDENTLFLTRYARYMSNSIQQNKLKNILSLGIGHHIVSDILSNELNHSANHYVILEGSESIIANFKIKPELKERTEVIHTYFEDFDTDEKFDAIEMGFILEHVDDPKIIIEKYKGFLSPTGKMFIGVPNARSLHRLIGFEAGLLKNLYELSEYDLKFGHKRYFDVESISNLVKQAGLKIENKIGLLLKPITTSQMQQLGWNKEIGNALLKLGDQFPEISNSVLIEAVL